DMRGTTLWRQIGDTLLIQAFYLLIRNINPIKERLLVQPDVIENHLFGRTETLCILLVVFARLLFADLDRRVISRHCYDGKIAGLLLKTSKILDLLVGDETGSANARLELAHHHFPAKQLAELQPRVTQLLDKLVEASGVEHAIDGKFGSLQNQLVESHIGEGEISLLSALQQQGLVDEPSQRGFSHQSIIQQRGIEVPTQLLHQLAALHIHRLVEIVQGDLFAINLGGITAIACRVENGLKACERQQHDDDANDGFGNPAL